MQAFHIITLVVFFIVFKIYGIYAATASAIALAVFEVLVTKLRKKKIQKLQIIFLITIVVFGGATLILHNPVFIKWKVSVVYWILGLAMLISQYLGKKPLIQHMLNIADKNIILPHKVWLRLSWSWVIFCVFIGCLNVYVIFHYSTNDWVDFKLFGILGITFIFFIGQTIYLIKHMKHDSHKKN
jgi:intracellular septation protein